MKRLFVGIPLPDVLRDRIEEFCQRLKETGGDFRFVSVENLHLTVCFLGDVEEDQISGVIDKVRLLLAKQGKIKVNLVGAGCFPDKTRINVVWVGLGDGGLINLIRGVNAGLSVRIEHEEEIPHLTVARVKSGKRKEMIREVVEKFKDVDFGSFVVEKIFLYESELEPEGPIYTVVKEFELL